MNTPLTVILSCLLFFGGGSHGFAAATRVLRGESATDLATAQHRLATSHQLQLTKTVQQRRLASATSNSSTEGSIWSLIKSRSDTFAVRMLVEVAGLQEVLSDPSSGITMAIPLDTSFGSHQEPCFSNQTLALELLLYHMMILPSSASSASIDGSSSDNLLISLISALAAASSSTDSYPLFIKNLDLPTLLNGTEVSVVSMAAALVTSSFPSGAAGIAFRDAAGRLAHILDWATSPSAATPSNDTDSSQEGDDAGDDAADPAARTTTGEKRAAAATSTNAKKKNQTSSTTAPGAWAALFIDRVMTPLQPRSLEEALLLDDDLSTTLAVLTAANFSGLLKARGGAGGGGPPPSVTLLAPTNAAWEAAFLRLNVTSLEDLAANPTLLASVASTHLLGAVRSYQQLYDGAGTRYFSTLNSCSQIYCEIQDSPPSYPDDEGGEEGEEDMVRVSGGGGGGLRLNGAGVTGGSSASITEADLIGGRLAVIHRLDSVLLPLVKWGGGKCRYGQPPSPPPPRASQGAAAAVSASNSDSSVGRKIRLKRSII